MGRPKLTDRPTRWSISIPQSVAARVELILSDPARGNFRYGSRSDLCTALLREWLANQTHTEPEGDPTDGHGTVAAEA